MIFEEQATIFLAVSILEFLTKIEHPPRMKFDSTYLEHFSADILVRCSRCSRSAHLIRLCDAEQQLLGHRFVCASCGSSRDWVRDADRGIRRPSGGPDLQGFDLSLWLQTECRGETLWAYNLPHVEFLETYIGAELRERRRSPEWGWSNSSMQSRLPKWMLDAHHRADVLTGLGRLRALHGSQ